MTWFKVDDGLHSHPKVARLFEGPCPGDALGLWLCGGSWSARELTEGVVPIGAVKRFGFKRKAASELVRVGLWELHSEGFLIHDYLKYNKTKAQVLAEREATKLRVSEHRDRKRNAVTNGVGNAAVTPSPDPDPVPQKNSNTTRARVREEQEPSQNIGYLPGSQQSDQSIGFDFCHNATGQHWMGYERTCALLGAKPAPERERALAAALADGWIQANRRNCSPDYFLRKWPSLSSGDTTLKLVASDGKESDRSAARKRAEQLAKQGKELLAERTRLKPLVDVDPDARARSFVLDNLIAETKDRFDRAKREAAQA